MRNKFILLVIIMCLSLGFVSCSNFFEKLPFFDNPDNDVDGNSNLEGLVLIENKVAKFQLVYTSDVGSEVVKRAEELVKQLRALDIEINDPISDSDKNISDCEIIIGTSAKNRGDELSVTQRELGKDGLIIKIVGEKVLIAGGTSDLTLSLFEHYIKEEMKITKKTESIDSLAVNPEYTYNRDTVYKINSITLAGVDIREYTVIYDTGNLSIEANGPIKSFCDKLYNVSGYSLSEGTIENIDKYTHKFIFRYTDDAGEKGFRIYAKNGDFIIESSYSNALERTFEAFANSVFYNTTNNTISLPENYLYEADVTKAYYNDFGAKGDGITCDFAAMLATHEYANEGGQTVYGTPGSTYYIAPESFVKSLPVKTDVNLNGARIIIDDRGSAAFKNKQNSLYMITGDIPYKTLKSAELSQIAAENGLEKLTIQKGTTSLSWLVPYLDGDSYIRPINANQIDYTRHGGNEGTGVARQEVLVIDKEGNITENTKVFFEYEDLTSLLIWSAEEEPLSVGNGTVYNIAPTTLPETDYKVVGSHYFHGIYVSDRSNVTIYNMTHRMVDQPIVERTPDGKYYCNESYPYAGFIFLRNAYNITVNDTVLAGHTMYVEEKAGTASGSGLGTVAQVPIGTYDINIGESAFIFFNNVTQENIDYTVKNEESHEIVPDNGGIDNGIGDSRYWGIMCTDRSKVLEFRNCSLNRIDAHGGFFNVKVYDTEIGHSFNVIGGDLIYAENVTRLTGGSFITTRSDFGGSFEGDIILKNCTLKAYQSYNSFEGGQLNENKHTEYGYIFDTGYSTDGQGGYWTWDFGYECYMPKTLTLIESFTSEATRGTYVSKNDYYDYYMAYVIPKWDAGEDYIPYHLIEKVIYEAWGDAPVIPLNSRAAEGLDDYMSDVCEMVK